MIEELNLAKFPRDFRGKAASDIKALFHAAFDPSIFFLEQRGEIADLEPNPLALISYAVHPCER